MAANNSLIVFNVSKHFFGIIPSDFEQHLVFDQLWINPVQDSPAIWEFEGEVNHIKGKFVQIEALFGFFPAHISHNGHIFLTNKPNLNNIGLFINNLQMEISLNRAGKKTLEIDQISNLPQEIPKSVFHFVLQHKRKKIMVIDPLKLFNYYRISSKTPEV